MDYKSLVFNINFNEKPKYFFQGVQLLMQIQIEDFFLVKFFSVMANQPSVHSGEVSR